MIEPLIMTKLFIPRSAPNCIRRESLTKKWLKEYKRGSRITLFCAPAGYGKTTLMLTILKEAGALSVWLSLDEDDNDPQRFMLYLCAAFQKAGIKLPDNLEALLGDAGFQPPDTLITLLVSGLTGYEKSMMLVLDDYHLIKSEKNHSLVQFLLSHLPPKMHLAILTREDPPLSLSRFRVTEELLVFRAGDLLLDDMEIEMMLEASLHKALPGECIAQIAGCTEGWAAGIKLYALALKDQDAEAAKAYIQKISETHAYIIDYLVEEVLSGLPDAMRSFLKKTSVLSRMDGRLCDAVTRHSDGREMLLELSRRNLFIIPLDDKKEWFRYHALFAGSIRTGLNVSQEQALCLDAAIHMKDRGFLSEAIAYAFQAHDDEKTLKLVEAYTEDCFRTAQLNTLLHWLDRLPENMVQSSEILCVRRPIALFITGRYGEALSRFHALGPDFQLTASKHNRGLYNCLKAMFAGAQGQDTEQFAREALLYLEPWDPIARTSAFNTLGRSQFLKGNVLEAAQTFRKALETSLPNGHQFVTTLVTMNYSSCLGVSGKYREALKVCEEYLDGMKKQFGRFPPYAGILYVTMAGFMQALGSVEEAEKLKTEGEALCKSISYDIYASLKVYQSHAREKNDTTFSSPALMEKLSDREHQILKLICEGLSNGEISKKLFISTNTTQWHISHLYGKLGVKSRTQAAAKARELRII